MGSGPRIQAFLNKGILLGITLDKFPFAVSFSIFLGPIGVFVGIGKAYDE